MTTAPVKAVILGRGNRCRYFWPENRRGTCYTTRESSSPIILSCRPILHHQRKSWLFFYSAVMFPNGRRLPKEQPWYLCVVIEVHSFDLKITDGYIAAPETFAHPCFVTTSNVASPTHTWAGFDLLRHVSDRSASTQETAVILIRRNRGPYFWPENRMDTLQNQTFLLIHTIVTATNSASPTKTWTDFDLLCCHISVWTATATGAAVILASRNRGSYFWSKNLTGTPYRIKEFWSAVPLSRRSSVHHQPIRWVWFIVPSCFRSDDDGSCKAVILVRGNRGPYFWPETRIGIRYRTKEFCSPILRSRQPIQHHQPNPWNSFIVPWLFRSDGDCTWNSRDTVAWNSRSIFLTWEPQTDT